MPRSSIDILTTWASRIAGDPQLASFLDCKFRFEISGDGGGSWILSSREPWGPRPAGSLAGVSDCVVTLSSADLALIADGSLNPQEAYLSRRIRLADQTACALRLCRLIDYPG